MADVGRNKSSSAIMVAAFLVMGGFLYWLSVASEPTEFVVAEEAEEEPVERLTVQQFGQDPVAYEGEMIELEGVEVAEILGVYAFFFELPDGDPYLVRLHPEVVQAGVQLLPEDRARLAGRVEIMTDSVLEVWDAEQVFTDEQRERAAAVESFIYAEEVEVTDAEDDVETDDPDED